MTAQGNTQPGTGKLLESILDRVESIDKNVEDILERISDHYDDLKYASWNSDDSLDENGYH